MIRDLIYYKQLRKIKDKPDFYYFEVPKENLEEYKKKFIASKFSINPSFKYDNLPDQKEIDYMRSSLNDLKDMITRSDDQIIKKIYFDKSKELDQQIKLVYSSVNFEVNNDSFYKYTNLLYGELDEIVKKYLISFMISKNKNFVIKSINNISEISQINILPNKEFIDFVKSNYRYDIRIDEENDSLSIKNTFEEILKNENILDWNVEVDKQANNINIDTYNNKILIPIDKKLNSINMRKIINHEILTHVRRSSRGSFSGILLLKNGLAYYDEAEEGLAKFSEQIVTNKFQPKNIDISYGIAQALGVFDGRKKDFKETFSSLLDFFSDFYNLDELKSIDKAWNICYRIFRGTNCNVPGVVYNKDIIYLRGLLNIYIKSNDLIDKDLWFGKYNFFIENPKDFILD